MKIFRQLIETEEMGFFLADAIHENGKIQSLRVFPVDGEIVGRQLEYTLEDLSDLAAKMLAHLTKSLE
jgi:hypothetical protein